MMLETPKYTQLTSRNNQDNRKHKELWGTGTTPGYLEAYQTQLNFYGE